MTPAQNLGGFGHDPAQGGGTLVTTTGRSIAQIAVRVWRAKRPDPRYGLRRPAMGRLASWIHTRMHGTS